MEIETLFRQWLVAANRSPTPEEDADWNSSQYAVLQRRILQTEPKTARDLAIQCYVDCDCLGSDRSDQFEALILRLVDLPQQLTAAA